MTHFTYHRWRKEFGRRKTDQVKRLNDLEKGNGRLRKAVSDLTVETLILVEAARGPEGPLMRLLCAPPRRRARIEHVRKEFRVSERLACCVLGQDPSR